MRPTERFRAEGADEALDPEAARQLAAIDAALAGDETPAGVGETAQLVRELRDERAVPDPGFAARLDRWAASGFERSTRHQPRADTDAGRRRERFAGILPRRMVVPVGAVATLVVVVGVAISAGGLGSGGEDPSGVTAVPPDSGDSVTDAVAVPEKAPPAPGVGDPAVIENAQGDALASPDGRTRSGFVRPEDRKQALAADLVLAAEPEEVRDVSDGVNEVVNRYRGIVVSSSVQSGDTDDVGLGSQFQLRIPAANLQAALADLSELAHVESRTESVEDITARFLSAQERIDELEAERQSLLTRLADADTDDEVATLRRQLDSVNSALSATRAELDNARERVQLVPVTVSIVSEQGAGDDGDWGLDEALSDAADVLSTAAGVVVIAGAVLLPLALVALLVALSVRTRTNRARDRALDE
ncbi:MAG: DUF4349 domain-containing protein [Solirubrobacterales bacterium]